MYILFWYPGTLWRFLLTGTLIFLLHFQVDAQSTTAQKNDVDITEVGRLFKLAIDQSNPDSSIEYLITLLPRAIAIKSDSICNIILLKLGEDYVNTGKCLQGIVYLKQAIAYCSTLRMIEQANDYYHLAWAYLTIADYVNSSENFYLSIEYIKKSGVITPEEPGIYNFLGTINFRLHQYEKALIFFNMGESIARKNNFLNITAFVLVSKVEYYTTMHQTDSARKCYNEAVEIADKIKRPDIKAEANEEIGKAYIESGDYHEAVYYLQLAVNLSKVTNKTISIDASYYLGEALLRLKKYDEAQATLVTALKQAAIAKLKDNAIKGHTTLMEVYKAMGEYKKALDCMDSISVLKDSLVNAEKAKEINLLDIKYQTAEKDKQIAHSQLLIAKQNSNIVHKNMLMISIGSGLLLLLLVTGGVYFHTLNKQRYLDKENKIGVLKAAIKGGDDERSRIARELHDGIGGMLGAAMMRFSSIHHDNAAITATPAYIEAMEILQGMGDEIRKTAHNLMPEVLLKQSLPEAIRVYCDNVQADGALKINFQYVGEFDNLVQEYKLNLYRIVQELVKNILQHSGASSAGVQLLQNEDVLILSVEDNGKGFDKNEMKDGQGLYNTRTRVKSLDGNFTLETNQGKGTSVFIEFTTTKYT